MSVGRICVREVHVASPEESVRGAARRMAEARVGTLVVVDGERRPLAMLTDRDVALRCVATGRDPDGTRVAEVMSAPVHAVRESASIESALERMAGHGVRRLAVVGEDDRLVGILSMDDVLDLLAEESAALGRLLARQAREGR